MELNLVYPDKSDIPFKISKFPDGQQDLEVISDADIDPNATVIIKSRFNSFLDLEIIICAVKCLRNMSVKNIELYIPYLLGARSDRKFAACGTSYLVQVIAPIINQLKLNRVISFDVHSDVAAACINNFTSLNSHPFINAALSSIANPVLISPDAGYLKKMYSLVSDINFNGEIVVCSKHRDVRTGKITDTQIGNVADFKKGGVLIVDDICDGGRTFIEIAKKIKNLNPGSINLFVTHGIFSNGYNDLRQYFNRIYCTNSVKEIEEDIFISQFNIF